MSGLPTTERTRFLPQPCGCLNFIDPEWGVQRCYSKCAFHKSESGHSGLKHHEVMGAIKEGVVQHENYVKELVGPLEEMDVSIGGVGYCLEIGCGVGSYIPLLLSAGYDYMGIEPDAEVGDFTRQNFGVIVCRETYEEFNAPVDFSLIFCAHAFEHMEDSPGMMAKAFSQLKPGGRLVLIVPNDDDLCNPDHLTFFSPETLRSVLDRIGFTDIRMAVRQRVKHEKFIYCACVK